MTDEDEEYLDEDNECIAIDEEDGERIDDEEAMTDGGESADDDEATYSMIPYGLQPHSSYVHPRKSSQLTGVSYDDRLRQFFLLDSKGIITWHHDMVADKGERILTYPNFEYRLISKLIYAKSHNIYFALGKDFELRVLNRQFQQTCAPNPQLRSVVFAIFNCVTDELITGGIAGTKIWRYAPVSKPDAVCDVTQFSHYGLVMARELPSVGGSWVKHVDLDLHLQLLFLCSRTDIFAFTLHGRQVFSFVRAHAYGINGCVYSHSARVLVTAGDDMEVKVWCATGGLLHVFRGHSRAVTGLLLHPQSATIVITSSLDGSVRMWSLDTHEPLYSLLVCGEGLLWMGQLSDRLLYVCAPRQLYVWSLNHVVDFWAAARNDVVSARLVTARGKSSRVVAVGEDNSVRVFSRTTKKNLSTVLPPPCLSPMQHVKGVAYNRRNSLMFLLIDTNLIWVYTTKTDPACRVDVWDVMDVQHKLCLEGQRAHRATHASGVSGPHRASLSGQDAISRCHCMCYLDSPAAVHTDEGLCCPLQQGYVLLGLEDGRVLFMDCVLKGKRHFQFVASKDAVVEVHHDVAHRCVVTRCRVGDGDLLLVWSLPTLQLCHRVHLSSDVTCFARLGDTLMTGHVTGAVVCHKLPQLDGDSTATRKHVWASSGEDIEHSGPVTAIDASVCRSIFVTCSRDGAVKIWDTKRRLLTEISLDDSLTTACFISDSASLLIGYNKHLFIINHSKICPSLPGDVEVDDASEVESNIFEDPSVLFEGFDTGGDIAPITLDTYLRPFDISLDDGIMKGDDLASTPAPEVKSDTVDKQISAASSVDGASVADTDMYLSPAGSYTTLCDLDLNLGQVMSSDKWAVSYKECYTDFEEDLIDRENYERPRFGVSPGTTPTPSLVSMVSPPGSVAGTERVEASDKGMTLSTTALPVGVATKGKKAKKSVKSEVVGERESLLGGMRVDAHSLMKSGGGAGGAEGPAPRMTETSRPATASGTSGTSSLGAVKKSFKFDRKLPPRGERKVEDDALKRTMLQKAAAAGKSEPATLTIITRPSPGSQDKRLKVVPAPPRSGVRRALKQRKYQPPRRVKEERPSLTDQLDTDSSPAVSICPTQPLLPPDAASGTVSDEDHALELGPEWSAPSSNATKRRGPLGAVPEDQSTDPVDRRSPDDVVVIEDGPATATVEEETKTEGGGDVREGEGEGGKGGRGRRTTRPRSTGGSRTWDPVASAAERARAWRPLSAPTSRKLNMQDLKKMFADGMKELNDVVDGAADEILQSNKGVCFDDDWEERMIDRGLLLRLRRRLRSVSAAESRRLAGATGQTDGDNVSDVSPPLTLSVESTTECSLKRMQRLGELIFGAAEYRDLGRSPDFRTRLRPRTANVCLEAERHRYDSTEKSKLAATVPYRWRLAPAGPTETMKRAAAVTDRRLLDPRSADFARQRPKSSVSIPSKSGQYVLSVGHHWRPDSMPTVLEAQLILDRFPQWRHVWLPQYQPPPPGGAPDCRTAKYASLPTCPHLIGRVATGSHL